MKNIPCKAPCMISDSLFCFERRLGSFTEPISGSQHSDVIQALHPITCGSEKFKCSNLMSSWVSEPPRLCVSHPSLCPPPPSLPTPLLQKTTFPAGSCFSVPRCKFRATSSKWGTVSASADCTQIKTSWPLQPICSTVKSERKAKGILILFERCCKCALSDHCSRIITPASLLTCIGMYAHTHTATGEWGKFFQSHV